MKEYQVYMKANTTAVTWLREDNAIQVDAEALMKSFLGHSSFGIESSPISWPLPTRIGSKYEALLPRVDRKNLSSYHVHSKISTAKYD